MIALSISDIKGFMKLLLKSDSFDCFLLKEAALQTNISYQMDGALHREFYTQEDFESDTSLREKYVSYANIRPILFDLIKGTHTPLGFRVVLTLPEEDTAQFLLRSGSGFQVTDIGGFFFQFRFKQGELVCTTGISYQTFSTNHLLDQEWDAYVTDFLESHDVSFQKG